VISEETLKDNKYVITLMIIIFIFRLIAKGQAERFKFYCMKGSMMEEFLKTTEVRKMVYIPYAFAVNNLMQCLIYVIMEIRLKTWYPFTYERELFILSDGGTIALDW
jgi:formate hydrogenlyase subunit 3/multisubunit Na+/H+ antiporter MnhD subunit